MFGNVVASWLFIAQVIVLLPLKSDAKELNETHTVRLIRHLLDNPNYDKRVRPVIDDEDGINVTLRMTLYQILEVKEPIEAVSLSIWMVQLWTDEMLAWDPNDFNNISYLVVPYDALWRPDTYLYNSLDISVELSERYINAELRMIPSDPTRAHVRFAYPARYTFSCNINVRYFPFDQQNCTMVFGSWVLDAKGLDYFPHADNVNLEPFRTNAEWELISFKTYRHQITYTCCPNPYTNVYYHLVIARKPLFYICNLVIPIITTAFVSFVGFFSPGSTKADRSEKISLGITTLLAMAILLLMIAERMPTTSDCIPLLGWFLLIIIIMTATAILFTTFVIQIQRRGRFGRKLSPRWQKILFQLAKMLLIDVPDRRTLSFFVEQATEKTSELKYEGSEFSGEHPAKSNCETLLIPKVKCNAAAANGKLHKLDNNNGSTIDRESTEHFALAQYNEWELVADVVERLFQICFILPLFVLMVSILAVGYHALNTGGGLYPSNDRRGTLALIYGSVLMGNET